MLRYYTPKFLFRRYEILKRIKDGYHFLEIGPGSLNLTEDLLYHFSLGTLVERNPLIKEFYHSMPESTKGRLNLIIDDFMSLDMDSVFDCIISCEVMEHIEDDGRFIDKMYDLLEKGGQIILSVPAHKKLWDRDDDSVGHIRRYEKNELHELFSKKKFRYIKLISYGFPFVNILRHLRILLAGRLYEDSARLSKGERSMRSGISPLAAILSPLQAIVNKYTVYPFCVISSVFNNLDLSDSYIITARK